MSEVVEGPTLRISDGNPKEDAAVGSNETGPVQSESKSGQDEDDFTKGKASKKRRKVNHACVYCRRSHMTCDQERPCNRCIKRNIGHLCHDEPREPVKRSKSKPDSDALPDSDTGDILNSDTSAKLPITDIGMSSVPSGSNTEHLPLLHPTPLPAGQAQAFSNNLSFPGYNDWGVGSSNQLDLHSFHPNYMFNTSEVSNEYNLLNDFLSTSLLDDGAFYAGDNGQSLFSDPSLLATIGPIPKIDGMFPPSLAVDLPTATSQAVIGNAISRPPSRVPLDKAREKYYMTAADPAGTDTPEERMNKLLRAKYDAGLLKPFNYVKGYARLNQYMERNMQATSRQRILRQLEKFRPRFRERMQKLTDIELVMVEMWFERKLMEYDRVFASMAIPACCWRRTGEIFRGNREMAELIHVPLEQLRDGKLTIHEIISEDSLVSYWEKFGAIAFDTSQKAMLTSCSLKTPEPRMIDLPDIKCCFSFTIQRDSHQIPSLIIGNFLPIQPKKS